MLQTKESLNNEVTFEIADVAFGGRGVGRVDNMACFVKGVIEGEQVKSVVRRRKARFMEADLLDVLRPSTHRLEAPCPYFLKCGGCAYQHIDYTHQLKIKEKQLREALRRIAGIQEPPVKTMIPSPKPFHYRNRITVHVKDGVSGFFVEKGHDIVEIKKCLLASEEVNEGLKSLKSKHPHDGDYLIGEKERYGGFRQVNNDVAEILLQEVMASAGSGSLLIDAYCGAGFFSHALRGSFGQVIGIERSHGSIALARQEAQENETFFEGGVEEFIHDALSSTHSLETVLILDPPSEGLSELVVAAILSKPPGKIIYVSCDPSTLARDVKKLSSYYQLNASTPVDMFPQTAEIESINVLEFKK
ncbi:MAG: class I SAM-dependent RNA methyltransferase [Chthoniobacterales bacterium]